MKHALPLTQGQRPALSLGALSSYSGFCLPLTIWLGQIAVQTWARVSALVSGLARTLPETGELSGLAICLWVAQAESAEKMCWWERNSSSLCLNKAAALANHWPRISRRGNNCKAPNLPIPLSSATNQNNSSKRNEYWVRSLAILQARLLGTGLSAPDQPEPLLGKSCNRQISLVRSRSSPQHMVWD